MTGLKISLFRFTSDTYQVEKCVRRHTDPLLSSPSYSPRFTPMQQLKTAPPKLGQSTTIIILMAAVVVVLVVVVVVVGAVRLGLRRRSAKVQSVYASIGSSSRANSVESLSSVEASRVLDKSSRVDTFSV